jgi:hypothetical protein
VTLRGLNVAGRAKVPTFTPFDDLQVLDSLAVFSSNVARLPFIWEAYESVRGQYNTTYLNYYRSVVQVTTCPLLCTCLFWKTSSYTPTGSDCPVPTSPSNKCCAVPLPIQLTQLVLNPEWQRPLPCFPEQYTSAKPGRSSVPVSYPKGQPHRNLARRQRILDSCYMPWQGDAALGLSEEKKRAGCRYAEEPKGVRIFAEQND